MTPLQDWCRKTDAAYVEGDAAGPGDGYLVRADDDRFDRPVAHGVDDPDHLTVAAGFQGLALGGQRHGFLLEHHGDQRPLGDDLRLLKVAGADRGALGDQAARGLADQVGRVAQQIGAQAVGADFHVADVGCGDHFAGLYAPGQDRHIDQGRRPAGDGGAGLFRPLGGSDQDGGEPALDLIEGYGFQLQRGGLIGRQVDFQKFVVEIDVQPVGIQLRGQFRLYGATDHFGIHDGTGAGHDRPVELAAGPPGDLVVRRDAEQVGRVIGSAAARRRRAADRLVFLAHHIVEQVAKVNDVAADGGVRPQGCRFGDPGLGCCRDGEGGGHGDQGELVHFSILSSGCGQAGQRNWLVVVIIWSVVLITFEFIS